MFTSISRGARRRWIVPAALAVVAAIGFSTLVSTSSQAATKADDKILKVALVNEVDTLNPFTAVLRASTAIMMLQYESLVQFSAKDNSIVPGMASKWETSADGLTWTFTLPKGRKWSDGEPVTAKDAAYTYNGIMKNEAMAAANGGLVTNIASVTAKDDETLVIVLKEPQAPNPGAELPIVPEHVYAKQADASKFANDKDGVGSGPFVIKSYKAGGSIELVANKNFWRGAPKIDGITEVTYKSTDAAVQALKTGEIDLIGDLVPAQFNALKGAKNITTSAGDGRRYQALGMNPGAVDVNGKPMGDGNPVLKDLEVRQAIYMAIDKKTLVDKVLDGKGTIGETEIPPVYPDYFGVADDKKFPFDPEAANAKLDAAGYKKGPDGIRLDKEGKPIKLRLMGRTSNPRHVQMGDFIKPWLKAIGIDIEMQMVSDNQVNDDSTLGKYDLYFTGWGLSPDPDFQLSINLCSSMPNADGSGALTESNWCDPKFDALFKQQHTELDHDKRAQLVKDAWAIKYEQASNDVLYYEQFLEAYRSDRFGGWDKQPAKTGVIAGQNGYWGFYSAEPVGSSSSDDGGWPTWATVVILAGVLVAAGAFVASRRRTTADDRE